MLHHQILPSTRIITTSNQTYHICPCACSLVFCSMFRVSCRGPFWTSSSVLLCMNGGMGAGFISVVLSVVLSGIGRPLATCNTCVVLVGVHGVPDSRHVIQTSCLQCMPHLEPLRHVAIELQYYHADHSPHTHRPGGRSGTC